MPTWSADGQSYTSTLHTQSTKLKMQLHSIFLAVTCSILLVAASSMPTKKQRIDRATAIAELKLLNDLAFARKTYKQVSDDAKTFSYDGTELQNLIFTRSI